MADKLPQINTNSPVTALIVTYAPSESVLAACIKSLISQNPKPHIVIADNVSPKDPDHEVVNKFRADDCTVMTIESNLGFGGAINRILPLVKSKYILISNFDIVYDPQYLAFATWKLENSEKSVVGIAGKTLFYPPDADSNWPGRGMNDPALITGRGTGGVIDNTGTLVNGLMLAYNRGVGQIDIGQYDISDRPMGACFAAFLAKTEAFSPIPEGGAGMLDPSYFMYYEDIDWCYRANILGFRILYEPRAVAWHHHSLTTRELPLFFKYHLIQRNLYRTIMKNMKFRTAIRLHALHARLHIRRAKVERNFIRVTSRILGETLLWSPAAILQRGVIQRHRKVSDTDIVNISIGEEGHLDDVSLYPKKEWSNVLASLRRLQKHFPEDPACRLIPDIEIIARGIATPATMKETLELAGDACPALLPLMNQISLIQ